MKIALLFLFLTSAAQAATSNQSNLIAIGQGISSPTLTSPVNYSSGYTHESPNGVLYQNSLRLSAQYDNDTDGNTSTGRAGYGGELGYGNGSAGLAGGYYTRDCDNCKGRFAGSGAVAISGVGLGLRYEEHLYTAGLLFNTTGNHRFGVVAEFNDGNGEGNDLKSYGAGYSYVANQWTFTIDASKRDYENKTTYGDRILLTPGLMVRADFLQLSLNDKMTLHDRDTGTTNDKTTHDFWFGVGIGGDSWHLAGYGNYYNDVSASLSFFF